MLTHIHDSDIGLSYKTDHAPVYVRFSLSKNVRGRGYWRIPNYLYQDPVYNRIVDNTFDKGLQEAAHMAADTRWDFIKTMVKGESMAYVNQAHKQRNEWVTTINKDIVKVSQARDNVSNTPIMVRNYSQKLKLLQIERDELIMCHTQKSRQYNTARKHYEMNRSTHYYFKLPGCKYDSVKALKLDDGTVTTDTKQILNLCKDFYNNLYNKVPHPMSNDEDLKWEFLQHLPSLEEPQLAALDADLTIHELRQALGNMKRDASPGMDGFTVNFYIHFWPCVGNLLLQSYKASCKRGQLAGSQRRGLIRLTPKRNHDTHYIHQWRPISLLPVDYKILSKALANRLATVLPSLISRDQRGFIKGRYIGENIMEVYSLIAQAEQEEEGILMLLDIQKAFDSVSWDFLFEVLRTYNLPTSFIHWVQVLYHNKELQIFNNGYMSDPFYPHNGVAQGDGLSPLLFILAIETLACSIRMNSKIQGFQQGSFHKKLGLLADDMILGLKARQCSFDAVFETLLKFAKLSNLKVNTEKSAIFPIGKKRNAPDLVDILPFTWSKSTAFTYLGVEIPLISSARHLQNRTNILGNIMYHVRTVLCPRNNIDHALLGRVNTVRAFIGSKLNYLFTLGLSVSSELLTKIQSEINAYIWSYGMHVKAV